MQILVESSDKATFEQLADRLPKNHQLIESLFV
jgi:hypothetical protein